MTDDTPLAALWRFSRMLRLADGPDEVHKMVLARRELNRWAQARRGRGGRRAGPEARAAGDLSKEQGRPLRPPLSNVHKRLDAQAGNRALPQDVLRM